MLPPVDVRRKRPPALSFLLRMETLRKASRVVSLLALDFAGAVRGAARRADGQGRRCATATGRGRRRCDEARQTIAFAYLVTVLLFARSGLYAERAQRPGLARIVSSLFQVDGRRADLRAGQRRAVLQLLHLLRHARLRGDHPRARARWGYEQLTGVAAAGRGLPPPRGARRLRAAHRGRRARADRRGPRAGRDGRLHLAHAAAGQRPALARADRGRRPRCSTPTASRK